MVRRGFTNMGLLVGVMMLSAVGCAPSSVEPVRLLVSERSYLGDVPLPLGFRIVGGSSEDRWTSRRRAYVRHVYEGKGDAYSVRNFYIENMPQYRWRMVHAGNVEGIHTMRFEKGPESCTFTISQASSVWGDKVRIQVMILQEERGDRPVKPR